MRKTAGELFEHLKVDDPLFEIAQRLEEVALADEFFIERKLYPNVDFYTGLIYRAMGFRPACSPCCSRWVACLAGSLSGAR